MKKPKIVLSELGPIRQDGSRETVQRKILATCTERGTAELIASYLRSGAYKEMLETVSENRKYTITVEQ